MATEKLKITAEMLEGFREYSRALVRADEAKDRSRESWRIVRADYARTHPAALGAELDEATKASGDYQAAHAARVKADEDAAAQRKKTVELWQAVFDAAQAAEGRSSERVFTFSAAEYLAAKLHDIYYFVGAKSALEGATVIFRIGGGERFPKAYKWRVIGTVIRLRYKRGVWLVDGINRDDIKGEEEFSVTYSTATAARLVGRFADYIRAGGTPAI